MPKALIWGESIVGSGHARVQSELARALQAQGWEVYMATSSQERFKDFDQGNATVIPLPGAHLGLAGGNPYNPEDYVTPGGKRPSQDLDWQDARKNMLLDAYRAIRPDAVITEMWPYGRVYFDPELTALAQAVRTDRRTPPPRLYSLARDIMFPSTQLSHLAPDRRDRHLVARKYFKPGSIVVRGDKNFIGLSESLGPIPAAMQPYFRYAGYFADTLPASPEIPPGRREVIVTAGGGSSQDSIRMMRKAIEARKYTKLKDNPWRVLASPACEASEFGRLQALAKAESPDGNIVVERNRKDFSTLMSRAALIVTHGGNTVIEAVCAGIPALVVPLDYTENNNEQLMRTEKFREHGLVESARMAQIEDARFFAGKIDAASKLTHSGCDIRIGGAERMAQMIAGNYARRETGTVLGQ